MIKKLKIHGAYKNKERAQKKERKVKGWIVIRKINGQKRFVVISK